MNKIKTIRRAIGSIKPATALLSMLAAAAAPPNLSADSLMMTTWYPAPYGVYSQLRSTGNSYFAYQGGSVGIGTTNPASLLHIKSAGPFYTKLETVPGQNNVGFNFINGAVNSYFGADGTQMFFYSGTNSRQDLTILSSNGNVGIGTAGPATKLSLSGCGVYRGINTCSNWTGDYAGIVFEKADQTSAAAIQHQDNGDLAFFSHAGGGAFQSIDQKMIITPAGNLGVGTPSPLGRVTALTPVNVNAFRAVDVSDRNYLTIGNPANGATTSGWSTTPAVLLLGADYATGRSINAGGSVNASGADYAEWIPWKDAKPEPGTIIRYKGSFLVVSSTSTAAVTGNDRFKDGEAILVAFAGQVPVKVRGKVREGDLILPNGDGTGSAVSLEAAGLSQYKRAVGVAWEPSTSDETKLILTAVGIK